MPLLNHYSMKRCIILFALILPVILNAQVAENTSVNASLQFIKNNKRVDIRLTLHYKVMSDEAMTIGNLRDYYGSPSLWKYMTELKGLNGTVVTQIEKGDSIRLVPFNKQVSFTYLLNYDSAVFSNATYAPNVGENHVHFAFCQWMLPIAERTKVLAYNIEIEQLPADWISYSSAAGESKNISFTSSLSNSFSVAIGAGIFYKKTYNLRGKLITVYINGTFDAGNEKFANLAYKTVSYQHEWFNDFKFNFYSVVLLPKEGNLAGISIPNMFLCHLKKDAEYQRLAWLMSHEMLHGWTRRISIKDTTSFGLRHQWFKEGINDYLAYLVLLDSKLFCKDEFMNSINNYLKNIKENPFSDASEDSMKRVAALGKYGVAATKLAYYKGDLIGFAADQGFLKESKKGLQSRVKDFILYLLSKANSEGTVELSEQEFFSISDSMHLPLRELYQKYILKGEPQFDLPPTVFDGSYELRKVKYHVYDPGFTYAVKNKKYVVGSIDSSGPAFQAGIRNDREIVSSTVENRFSNAWCNCPVSVTVLENGQQRKFEYMPVGKEVEVMQYVRR